MKIIPAALTQKTRKLRNVLHINVLVTPPNTILPKSKTAIDKTQYEFTGIWDTGASSTAVSEEVVDKLQLKPISMINIITANGTALTTAHLVDLHLPSGAVFRDLVVTKAKLHKSVQILVGMDVINQGDFTISNFNGQTCVSFRVPSLAQTDYVALAKSQMPKKQNQVKINRNDNCPCGSGKKYRNCCSK